MVWAARPAGGDDNRRRVDALMASSLPLALFYPQFVDYLRVVADRRGEGMGREFGLIRLT